MPTVFSTFNSLRKHILIDHINVDQLDVAPERNNAFRRIEREEHENQSSDDEDGLAQPISGDETAEETFTDELRKRAALLITGLLSQPSTTQCYC